ncbi:MAG: hypothetical protein VXX04_01855 [Actinomycetota bacterium]|nr:hypothetical protein [Actinomycetota bacterium]
MAVPRPRQKKSRTACDDVVTITVVAEEVSNDAVGCVVLESQRATVTTNDFPPVTLDAEGYPQQRFASPLLHSPYMALNARDPDMFPLSTRAFLNRTELFAHGERIGCTPWRYDRVRAVWTACAEGATRVCALIINERYEPRWGSIFCTDTRARKRDVEWQADLTSRSIPVFLVSLWGNDIRYCGHWHFERTTPVDAERTFEYVLGQRPRHGVHRVRLSHYDESWGAKKK